MSQTWHLAQINVAHMRYPLEHPRMRGFVNQLDTINALAEASPGFIWRLQGDSGNATDIEVAGEDNLLINMSVWRTAEDLFNYVYKTAHRDVMTLRRHWFERPQQRYQGLWWVPEGHLPDVEEGLARLQHLRQHGPSQYAFNFQSRFPAEGDHPPDDMKTEPYCAGWD